MSISTTSTPPALHPVHRLPAGGRLADHLEIVGGLDQHPKPGAQQGLVVGQQYPGAPGVGAVTGSSGRVAVVTKPPSESGAARSSPPTLPTRSRMPINPKPPVVRAGPLDGAAPGPVG